MYIVISILMALLLAFGQHQTQHNQQDDKPPACTGSGCGLGGGGGGGF